MPTDAEDRDETDIEAKAAPAETGAEAEVAADPEIPYETAAEPESPSEADYVEAEREMADDAADAEEGPAEDAPAAEAEAEPPADAAPAFAAFAEEVREALGRMGEQVQQRLAGLQSQFDREVRAEANRERIVDRLHAELQEYKQDLLLKVLRPVFVDLIQLHDDVGKMAQALAPDAEGFRGTLGSIQTALEDVLYRQGVEPFRAEGEAFDPRRQRAVATVPTPDAALAKTVAARIRPGFQSGEKVIRPEVVSVFTVKAE